LTPGPHDTRGTEPAGTGGDSPTAPGAKRFSPLRTALEWTAGLALIALGIIGGFIPVLQGWVFLLAGLAILSRHSRWASKVYERVKGMGRRAGGKAAARQTDALDNDKPSP
jgi:putative transmembrane protein PGPGW